MSLSESHKKKRSNRITSTTAAAALGLDPRMGPHGAARKILGLEEVEENFAMLRGSIFEEAICNLAEQVVNKGTDYLAPMPVKLVKQSFRVHQTHNWLGTSPDRIATIGGEPAGVVEAKSYRGARQDEFGLPGSDEVDKRTFMQCCIHMAVTELPWTIVPVDMGFHFWIYKIQRDQEFEHAILLKLENFWKQWIEPNIGKENPDLPPVDGFDATADWLKDKWKDHNQKLLNPSQEELELASMRESLKEEIKPLELELKRVENEIKNRIGESGAAGFKDDMLTMTWKQVKGRSKTDYQGAMLELAQRYDIPQAEMSELVKQHTTIGEGYRRLYVKMKTDSLPMIGDGK